MARPIGADFTLVYDDQSYDARDLRSVKGNDDPDTIALIRGKFKFAARDALKILKELGPVRTAWTDDPRHHPVRFVSLTEFINQPIANEKEPYLGLPVLITAAAYQFVDLEEKDFSIRALYYSPSVADQMERINQMTLEGHQKTVEELTLAPFGSAAGYGNFIALVPGLLRDHPPQFDNNLYRQVDQILANDLGYGFPRKGPYSELLFVNAESERLRRDNERVLPHTFGGRDFKSKKGLFKDRDEESAAALQQIITQGLADNSSAQWPQFLKRGLYDPRLFFWIAYYLDPKKRE